VPLFIYLKNNKTYPRIGFFRKLPYPRIRILPIPIRVSVSVLHRRTTFQRLYNKGLLILTVNGLKNKLV